MNSFDTGYNAAQSAAALFDLDDWTSLRATGKDAVKFLQNFCTNDIQKLPAGEGCEAFLTNVKARVLAHVLIYHRADDGSLQLLTSPAQAVPIIGHLDRYIITEDVTVADQTHSHGLLGLVGPRAEEILRSAGATTPTAAAPHRFATITTELAGQAVTISSFDGLNLPAYLIETALDAVEPINDRLIAEGAASCELDVFNSLRVEAVYPWGGFDVNEEHLAPEVDRPWAISLDKGCYLGQEPIARIDALGHVNRLLRGLRLEEEFIPEPQSPIFDGEKRVGEIRSTATSGRDGNVIALAFMRASHAATGTQVTVRSGELESDATVYNAKTPEH